MLEQWFENKVCLVTGGGSGIGRAAASLFARRGGRVAVVDLQLAAAQATADAIVAAGGAAIALAVDVADDSAVEAMCRQVLATYSRLDCAFNNAGVCFDNDSEWNPETTLKTLQVNLIGVMNCIRHEIPLLLEAGGGTIVNTASLAGFIANRVSCQPAYTASKHAVIGATKAAALQYARQNIRVNALCPGTTHTAMIEQIMAQSPAVRETLDNVSPMGRMATAAEMAEAAIWLCSTKSSYVNGHALVVDGGSLAE